MCVSMAFILRLLLSVAFRELDRALNDAWREAGEAVLGKAKMVRLHQQFGDVTVPRFRRYLSLKWGPIVVRVGKQDWGHMT